MATRTVMKANLECNKCKRVALQSITKIEGIDMILYNKKEQTLTVEGDADPAYIASQLKRKFKCATIIFVGPPPKPSQPANPPEEKEKKNGDPPKQEKVNDKSNPTPPPQNPVNPPYFIAVPAPYIMPYGPCKPVQPCCCSDCYARWEIPRTGCHPPQPHSEVYYVCNEGNPNLCTIS